MLSRRTNAAPSTGRFQMPVRTVRPRHDTSAGSPTFTATSRPSDTALLGLADRPRRVDEPNVAERLREVAEQLAGRRVDLLGEQPDVVDVRRRPLEDGGGLLHLARERSGV